MRPGSTRRRSLDAAPRRRPWAPPLAPAHVIQAAPSPDRVRPLAPAAGRANRAPPPMPPSTHTVRRARSNSTSTARTSRRTASSTSSSSRSARLVSMSSQSSGSSGEERRPHRGAFQSADRIRRLPRLQVEGDVEHRREIGGVDRLTTARTRSSATNAARGPDRGSGAQIGPRVVCCAATSVSGPIVTGPTNTVGLVEHGCHELRRRMQAEAVFGQRRGGPELASGGDRRRARSRTRSKPAQFALAGSIVDQLHEPRRVGTMSVGWFEHVVVDPHDQTSGQG